MKQRTAESREQIHKEKSWGYSPVVADCVRPREQRAQSSEQRAKNREQKTEHIEQRAENREQRAEGGEQKAKSRHQRAEIKNQRTRKRVISPEVGDCVRPLTTAAARTSR